nr:MAG TPA: hypothetical protein [Caudoviricetes sp.]
MWSNHQKQIIELLFKSRLTPFCRKTDKIIFYEKCSSSVEHFFGYYY